MPELVTTRPGKPKPPKKITIDSVETTQVFFDFCFDSDKQDYSTTYFFFTDKLLKGSLKLIIDFDKKAMKVIDRINFFTIIQRLKVHFMKDFNYFQYFTNFQYFC